MVLENNEWRLLAAFRSLICFLVHIVFSFCFSMFGPSGMGWDIGVVRSLDIFPEDWIGLDTCTYSFSSHNSHLWYSLQPCRYIAYRVFCCNV